MVQYAGLYPPIIKRESQYFLQTLCFGNICRWFYYCQCHGGRGLFFGNTLHRKLYPSGAGAMNFHMQDISMYNLMGGTQALTISLNHYSPMEWFPLDKVSELKPMLPERRSSTTLCAWLLETLLWEDRMWIAKDLVENFQHGIRYAEYDPYWV